MKIPRNLNADELIQCLSKIIGTLSVILNSVATHLGIEKQELAVSLL